MGQDARRGVADSNDIRFVAGSARNHTDDIKAFAKQHKFELYNSYEDMLKHPGLDAVVLATPHSLHVPQTIAAAKAGKHVFCEKPFALSGAERARPSTPSRRRTSRWAWATTAAGIPR